MCAKVSGPLMSQDASGSLAGAIVFSKWKGRNYVRQLVKPANPQSAAQTGVRTSLAGLVQLWQANTTTLTTNFTTRAKQLSISAFNAFTGYNQKRMAQGFFPANSTTPTEAAPAANATTLAATVNLKYVKLTWADSVSADAWTNAIYRKLGADPTGLLSEQIGLIVNGKLQFEDGPLAAGTWHYAIAAISTHGGRHALSAAVTATIT